MRVAIAVVLLVLAGCSSAAPGRPSPTEPPSTGRLVGHVGLYGGPARPDGSMAVSDAPRPDATVVATAARTRHSYRTTSDAAGRFAFTVPAGRYTVTSDGCQARAVTVGAGRTATVPIVCPVP